jgi:hypothetical protein
MAEPEQAEFVVAERLKAAQLKQSIDGVPQRRGDFTSRRLRFFLIGCR